MLDLLGGGYGNRKDDGLLEWGKGRVFFRMERIIIIVMADLATKPLYKPLLRGRYLKRAHGAALDTWLRPEVPGLGFDAGFFKGYPDRRIREPA